MVLFDVLVLILLAKFVPNSTIRAVPISIRLISNEPIKKTKWKIITKRSIAKKSFCFSNIEKINNLIVHKKSISCFLCKFELQRIAYKIRLIFADHLFLQIEKETEFDLSYCPLKTNLSIFYNFFGNMFFSSSKFTLATRLKSYF